PIVFELKRHRDKLQLLQAVSYAAMVARWTAEDFLRIASRAHGEQGEEVRALLQDETLELGSPRIILLAESFHPEVILTAAWLAGFGAAVAGFGSWARARNCVTMWFIDTCSPLFGVHDSYVGRSRWSARTPSEGRSWDDVSRELE